jgi:hypothetical protein
MQSRIKKSTHTQTGVAVSFSFPSHPKFLSHVKRRLSTPILDELVYTLRSAPET